MARARFCYFVKPDACRCLIAIERRNQRREIAPARSAELHDERFRIPAREPYRIDIDDGHRQRRIQDAGCGEMASGAEHCARDDKAALSSASVLISPLS